MKALSLWQPWASACALELKQNETRHWFLPYRGTIAIHAAKRPICAVGAALFKDYEYEFAQLGVMQLNEFPLGAVLCVCQIGKGQRTSSATNLSVRERDFGDYSQGRYFYPLSQVRRFLKPVPAKGAQGLWNWDESAGGFCVPGACFKKEDPDQAVMEFLK